MTREGHLRGVLIHSPLTHSSAWAFVISPPPGMQWKVVASGRVGATWQQLLLWWLLSPVTLRPLGQWPRRQLWLEKRPVLSCYLCVCGCSWHSVLQGFPSACSDGPWTLPPGLQKVVFEGVRGKKGFLVHFFISRRFLFLESVLSFDGLWNPRPSPFAVSSLSHKHSLCLIFSF